MFHEITGAGKALVDHPRRSLEDEKTKVFTRQAPLADAILTAVYDNCLPGDKCRIIAR